MTRNWKSFFASAFSLGLLALGPARLVAAPFNEAVPAAPGARQPPPGADPAARLFLPGSPALPPPPSPEQLGAPSWRAFRAGLWKNGKPGPSRKALRAMREDDEAGPYFTALDLRPDLERERLAGPVRLRRDYYPGGLRLWSEVRYDELGRRVSEKLFEPQGAPAFERTTSWEGSGFCPVRISAVQHGGADKSEIRFSLDAAGRPVLEQHLDAQAWTLLRREYRYNEGGRLVFMMETRGNAQSGWKWSFHYDGLGRLDQRRLRASDPRHTWRRTDYRWDSLGRPLAREERFENLGLEDVELPESDPREGFKYRWRWDWSGSGAEQSLLLKPWEGEGNENFPVHSRLIRVDDAGRLVSVQHRDGRGAFGRREANEYDAQGELKREERWGRPGRGIRVREWRMEYDAQGNWTSRLEWGAKEPAVRSFEYFPESAK